MASVMAHKDKVDHLDAVFPVLATEDHIDSLRKPQGALTNKGLDQTRAVGETLARNYSDLVEHIAEDTIVARCTNFKRTALSLQSILSGLLASRQDLHSKLQVKVDPKGMKGTIGAYDNVPTLATQCNAIMFGGITEAAQRQPHIRAARELLQEHLSFFAREKGDFRWIYAADYFQTSAAHRVEVPDVLKELEDTVITHSLWRFSETFMPQHIRAMTAAGLLRDILEQVDARIAAVEQPGGHPANHFCFYSGHDTTIIPLVQALTVRPLSAWPDYASAVFVELHELEDNWTGEHSNGTAEDKYGVRFVYNGTPLWVRMPEELRMEDACKYRNLVSIPQLRALVEHHVAFLPKF